MSDERPPIMDAIQISDPRVERQASWSATDSVMVACKIGGRSEPMRVIVDINSYRTHSSKHSSMSTVGPMVRFEGFSCSLSEWDLVKEAVDSARAAFLKNFPQDTQNTQQEKQE